MAAPIKLEIHQALHCGLVIPACPLALNARRKLDERRQRALFRYYIGAGAGGLAVGVHTTQFAIRNPKVGLFRPVLELAAEEMARAVPPSAGKRFDGRVAFGSDPAGPAEAGTPTSPRVRIAGLCGRTRQALSEATLVRQLGFHAGLLSLGALKDASEDALIVHCRAVAEIIPLFGFYLQPAAGGRVLPYSFWRRFAEIQNVVAIKIAPFNRYQTLDVVRAIAEAGRDDIALYTGNDDNIVMDLLTPFRFQVNGKTFERRIVGGLLGHWAVWTKKAVELHADCRRIVQTGGVVPVELLRRSVEVTDANAAFFDAANGYAGCIPGIHEVLRRQGLLEGIRCLDPNESLGPGQREEIDRVYRAHPHLNDDEFVARHRD
ncbi:MAG: dihydrodipicolinate synthase family protein [Verrucomicrobia bacterium]|nr:MAG: dihydrodipicolinate synthase family protein [Verrucomicrobiota bacterium]